MCIGGSAGSIGAYGQILHYLRKDSAMAFVIIVHRSWKRDNLRKLLAAQTRLPVQDVTDGDSLRRGRIFLAPHHTPITTDGSQLQLGIRKREWGWSTLVTDFLDSMATSCGTRSIAIILSGGGYDGSPALGAIRSSGGTVLAQSDAVHAYMPDAAILTGQVNHILSADDIGRWLTPPPR